MEPVSKTASASSSTPPEDSSNIPYALQVINSISASPSAALTFFSVPFVVGGALGYRRAIVKETEEATKLRKGANVGSPLLDSLNKKNKGSKGAKALPFNPAIHAGKAFIVGSALCVGTFGVSFGLLGWYNGVTSSDEGVALLTRWGRSLRQGFLTKIMGERAQIKYDEAEAEKKMVKNMTYDEEYGFLAKKYPSLFGDSEEEDDAAAGGASSNPLSVKFSPP